MGRRRKGLAIHGWINLDKPLGVTSTQAVGRVKRLFNAAKVGHGGTLDPLATGILPIALGEATKTVAYAMDGEKEYVFTIRFGIETETGDGEGAVSAESDVRPSDAEITAALPAFIGEIDQVPPRYSAIKVDGARAYDLARGGEDFEMKSRRVTVLGLTLDSRPDADHAVIRCRSGKGVYVRSLARDLARALGTVGHVSVLRRTAVGPFTEKGSISLDNLEALGHSARDSGHLLPVETALDDIPALALTEAEARRLAQGQAIAALPVASRSPFKNIRQGDMVSAMLNDRLVALAEIKGGEIRPVRVLNLDGPDT
ncbi:MAG: tRNA pseudouridine(55) synthase TruB [Alphaproteobacteria bacterium]|tara:strand:- start:2652 stop:3593 length:942 start_codon:yes stop_codon:yes gene_type:complete